jgi:YD repeat-containing protein
MRPLTWILPLLALGCSPEPTAEPAAPVPIEAPDPSLHALESTRCAAPEAEAVWSQTWADARRTSAVLEEPVGTPRRRHDWTYDAAGHLSRWRNEGDRLVVFEFDRDADGRITAWRRHQDGQRFSLVVERTDSAVTLRGSGLLYLDLDDGAPRDFDHREVHGWGETTPSVMTLIELLVQHHRDDDSLAGALEHSDFVEHRTLDELGRVLEMTLDWTGDGTVDLREIRTYSEDTVERAVDLDADGVTDHRVVQRFDEAGRLVEEQHLDAEALLRSVQVHYTAGLQHTEYDQDADGVVDEGTWLYLNANGNRIAKYEDADADGLAEWRKKYYYDAETGRRVFDARDSNVDGVVDQRWDYRYDEAGQLIEERRSNPQSGCAAAF